MARRTGKGTPPKAPPPPAPPASTGEAHEVTLRYAVTSVSLTLVELLGEAPAPTPERTGHLRLLKGGRS